MLTLISFAISGDKFRCSLIPDLAASTVETLNSLNASSICSGVATLVLKNIHMSARNVMILVRSRTTRHGIKCLRVIQIYQNLATRIPMFVE